MLTGNKRVLVVDDEKDVCETISLMLEGAGHETLIAANGEDALKMATDEKPDLVLLDILLPGIDGFEVLSKLKVDTETQRIPIIIVSGKRDAESVLKAKNLGSNEYLMKPFTAQELLKIISRCSAYF